MENAQNCSVATRRGRPVVLAPQERQKRIFDALETVYRAAGLEGASMDALASCAGMSKRTIYALFPSRAALFQAYLEQYGGSFLRPVPAEARERPLAERLRLVLSPEMGRGGFGLPLEILRGLIADRSAAPEVACAVLRRTCDVYRGILEEELKRGIALGEVEIGDVPSAAAMLFDMLRPWPVETMLDPGRMPDAATIAARQDLAIKVFLRGTTPPA